MPLPRLLFLTLLTLVAFAANSVLCRLALFEEQMDPALFTLLRLTSGALVLILVVVLFYGLARLVAKLTAPATE